MKEDIKKWFWGGAGIALALTIFGYAGKYLVAQEVQRQVAPIEQEYETFSATVSQMQFDDRMAEVQQEHNECMEDEYSVEYCDLVAEWRWEVWYPYLECASKVERFAERKDMCGPQPELPEPPGEIDP